LLSARAAGSGTFDYSNSTITNQLNYVNPPLRDTMTVLAGGWAALRFRVGACAASK
jgi:hypothetical protein